MDVQSRSRWEQYTKAKEAMLEHTHIPEARWWIVEAVDKKKARLNCISHLLTQVPRNDPAQELSYRLASTIPIITGTRFRRRCTFRSGTEMGPLLSLDR